MKNIITTAAMLLMIIGMMAATHAAHAASRMEFTAALKKANAECHKEFDSKSNPAEFNDCLKKKMAKYGYPAIRK